jgi:hypothetical protein
MKISGKTIAKRKREIVLGVTAAVLILYLVPLQQLGQMSAFAHGGHHHHYGHHHRGHHHGGQSASASISQENNQKAVCVSGSSTTGSCNQHASNTNYGNAVASNVHF